MPTYRDDGVVLRTHQLGEADRIITLLTREHGKIRAVAKGVRRTKSRIGARLEPFMYVDVQCYVGRNLDTVTQVETIAALAGPIIADFDLYTSGAAILEAADKLVPEEGEPAISQYWLLVGALKALANNQHNAALVLNSYLLRALAVAGWALSAFDCARCGEPGPHSAFSIPLGGSVCGRCRPPGAMAPAPETVELLGALLSGDWAVADQASARTQRAAAGIVAAYSQHYLERDIQALKHLPAIGA
ncbi:MAG: DNA repair protein RecO [Cellulomonadaceae bacterium]|jgi:DNA repair protein RecO (recombination protein O)|nr:DNA repair protein RecO [Cellulomonadaceae bacterium]